MVIFAYWLGILSAVFTAFYSFRLLYLTFYSKTFGYKSVIYNVHECSSFMFFSLICLCIGSIFFGFLFKDLFIGLGSTFFNHSIFVKNSITSDLDAEFLPTIIKLLPVIFSLIGMLSALSLYFVYFRFITYLKINKFGRQIYLFLNKRWYFDLIYSYFISRSVLYFGYEISFKTFDKGFIELIGPLGLVRFFSNFSKYLNKLNTGFIFNYVFFFSILFFIILICFFLVVIKFNLIVSSNLYIILFFFYLLVFYKK
jgi:NADH-ubiquinone oxidoreductase chain 5